VITLDRRQEPLSCLIDPGPSLAEVGFQVAEVRPLLSQGAPDARLNADDFLALFDLTGAESVRVHVFRCLAALFWLILLRPGGPASARNPPGTLQRQAARLLTLLR
jgi:hypothetical protein